MIVSQNVKEMAPCQVMKIVHGLPDEAWPEPDPSDPLSVVDQVQNY